MRQRAALARAFAARPALLLLDEPFAAVDEEQADELCGLLSAEADTAGATVLVVTHRIREACQLADRTMVVRAGRVVAEVDTGRHRPGSAGVDQAAARLRRAVAAATPGRSR
jgi:ABC-type nitrate/sulfonate/bicarbonate transport system ATPase subunit